MNIMHGVDRPVVNAIDHLLRLGQNFAAGSIENSKRGIFKGNGQLIGNRSDTFDRVIPITVIDFAQDDQRIEEVLVEEWDKEKVETTLKARAE